MAVVFVVALAYGATADSGAQTDAERAADLAASIACPQCSGQPVSESNAPIAEVIRTEIKQQVDAGLTDGEIRAVYVARYGEWVDLTPSGSGLTGVVWIAPFLVIGVAVGALALAFARWSSASSGQHATPEDVDIVDSARSLDGGDGQR
ncbi:MAG: cytochrome c-type biogenesis protein [Acidimicrobiales bacterium]